MNQSTDLSPAWNNVLFLRTYPQGQDLGGQLCLSSWNPNSCKQYYRVPTLTQYFSMILCFPLQRGFLIKEHWGGKPPSPFNSFLSWLFPPQNSEHLTAPAASRNCPPNESPTKWTVGRLGRGPCSYPLNLFIWFCTLFLKPSLYRDATHGSHSLP